MPRTHIVSNNFTSGRFAPTLHERYDYQGYPNGLTELDNFLILPQGGVTRRAGFRFVKAASGSASTRLVPFVLTATVAYVLEFGSGYIRFFTNNGRVETSPDVPLEVATPYSASDIADLHFASNGTRLLILHSSYAPRELVRLSALSWQLRTVAFAPPPTHEAGYIPPSTLTLGATSGLGVAVTAAGGPFMYSDTDRTLSEVASVGNGRATITSVNSSTSVTVDILTPFSGTAIASGSWQLDGSPAATLKVDKTGPVGARVTLTTVRIQPGETDIVTEGDFPDLSSWSDLSGTTVTSGTADAGSGDELLVDAAGSFRTTGVRVGHRVLKSADSTEDSVVAINGESNLVTSKNGSTWAAGNSYEIKKTGVAYVNGVGQVALDGGPQGIAWIMQQINTIADVYYRCTFDVADAPLSMMAGNGSEISNIQAEFTYQPGNTIEVIFKPDNGTTYLSFRNNQNQVAALDNVSVKRYNVDAWRADDVGRFVRMNNGVVEITEVVSPSVARGVVRKELDDDLDALAGAWSIETSQWSDTSGWPQTGAYQGGRLNLASSTAFPARVWGSRVAAHTDFSQGSNADDSFQYDLSATFVNPIEWLAGEKALLAGAQRNEYTLRGELGHTITPTAVDVSSPTGFGSAHMQPARAPQSVFFVNRSRKRLYENVGVDDFSGDDRSVQDRSILAEDLTAARINSVSYQQEPEPTVWITTDGQTMAGLAYLREHVIAGWQRLTTAGNVLSACVIPHPDGDRDQVWALIRRPTGSVSVEYLDDGSGYYGRLMLDSAVTGSFSPATTSVTGLDHLEGLTVTVLGDGIQQRAQVVSGGAITLDTAASVVEVGLPYTSTLTTLRPVYQGVPLSGLKLSVMRVSVVFLNTLNAVVNGERINFGVASTPLDTAQPLFSGIKELDTIGWDDDALITIVQDQPYPMTITAINRNVEIETEFLPDGEK